MAAAERDCRSFVDHVTALIQAGAMETAQAAKPRLVECRRILRLALDREARRIVQDYDTRTGAPAR